MTSDRIERLVLQAVIPLVPRRGSIVAPAMPRRDDLLQQAYCIALEMPGFDTMDEPLAVVKLRRRLVDWVRHWTHTKYTRLTRGNRMARSCNTRFNNQKRGKPLFYLFRNCDPRLHDPARIAEEHDACEHVRLNLDPDEWAIVREHVVDGVPQSQIARRMGVSGARVCQRYKKSLRQAKAMFEAA